MANCAICNAKAGLSPTKIEIESGKYPVCSNCYIQYITLDSSNVNSKAEAIEYFRNNIYSDSEIADYLTKRLDEIEKDFSEEIEKDHRRKERMEYINSHRSELLNSIMLTTGNSFEGHKIKEYLGVVSGESVIGTGFLSEFTAGVSDIMGGRSKSFSDKMKDVKDEAIEIMKEAAVELGGNAIIGVSFEFITFSINNMIGVSVSGTAVDID